MMTRSFTLLSSMLTLVGTMQASIQIDGKLNEDAWKNARVESGFKPLAQWADGAGAPPIKTSFRWFADKDALYLGIECEDPKMDELQATPGRDFTMEVFKSDTVEVFIDPKGKGTDYYQFTVNAGGGKANSYWIESGNTTGGEYGGSWNAAVERGKSAWTAEIRIPYEALYRTPSADFSSDWKFNITRARHTKENSGSYTYTSWSPLKKRFHEPDNFRVLSGLPKKDPAFDVFVEGGGLEILGKNGEKYSAKVTLQIRNDGSRVEDAKVIVLTGNQDLGSKVITFPKGKTTLEFEDALLNDAGSGKLNIAILDKDGKGIHQRWMTFRADYQPISVNFSEPFYAGCIFPGQNISEAKAEVKVRLAASTLAGAGLEVSLGEEWKESFPLSAEGTAEIRIPSTAIHEGENTYRLQIVKNGKTVEEGKTILRKLPPPTSGSVVYVDRNLNLVVNGRPIFVLGFMGGGFPMPYALSLANQQKYGWKASSRFMNALDGWMLAQPERLLPKEIKNLTRDEEPSQEMYDAMLKRIEERRSDPTGLFYYLNDEPECRGVSPVYLGYLYRFIKKHDPYHPVLIVTRSPELYTECADILSPHPYTDPSILPDGTRTMRPIQDIVDQMLMVRKAGRDKIAPWCTPQAFSYGFLNASSVMPTFEEFNGMV
ncbi:MAG: sugar-binding protein, partial [Chthoniobacterales bacterium]